MDNECIICLNTCDYKNEDDIKEITTECNHKFHKICLHMWGHIPNDKYNNCPICRSNIDKSIKLLNDTNKSRIWNIDIQPPFWIKKDRILWKQKYEDKLDLYNRL